MACTGSCEAGKVKPLVWMKYPRLCQYSNVVQAAVAVCSCVLLGTAVSRWVQLLFCWVQLCAAAVLLCAAAVLLCAAVTELCAAAVLLGAAVSLY